MHQTLRFGDLPIGTTFRHPKIKVVYLRVDDGVYLGRNAYNATLAEDRRNAPTYVLIHPDTLVTLTKSIDFFSLDYSAKFAYEQKVYTKISRNRARYGDITKHFEPSDSVSPL